MGPFTEKEAESILCIPLSLNSHKDQTVWRGEPTGEYSVRSGYKYLLHEGQNQLQINYKQLYKRLWNLELPSKIKITIWRCSRNYLPNYSNLHYRRLIGFATCRRCHTGAETREHLFRDCPKRRLHLVRWEAPVGSRVKINFDAAFNRNVG